MANTLYDKGREKFLRGEVSWNSHDIKAVLIDSADYTPNLATDEFLSDIPLAARVATTANLTNKTTTAGVADADDVTFVAASGDVSEYIVLYRDTGIATTSPLLVLIDTATGLPVIPNTGDLMIAWANTANKIFKL